jgi:hypothetical protein
MQNAQQMADNRARCVRVGVQNFESDGRNDRKEDLCAQPDDQGEIERGAKQSPHDENIQGGRELGIANKEDHLSWPWIPVL